MQKVQHRNTLYNTLFLCVLCGKKILFFLLTSAVLSAILLLSNHRGRKDCRFIVVKYVVFSVFAVRIGDWGKSVCGFSASTIKN